MLIIEDKIVSLDILEEAFACNLKACKGACCWEGDYGATLEDGELEILDSIQDEIRPYMTTDGIAKMKEGTYTYYEEPKRMGTPLLENGACIYLNYNKDGIALCGIEQAYFDGKINFRKPVSCHLFPVRVDKNEINGFHKLDYYRRDICNPACTKGKEERIPVYVFLKEALIRKFGEGFYEALEDAAQNVVETPSE